MLAWERSSPRLMPVLSILRCVCSICLLKSLPAYPISLTTITGKVQFSGGLMHTACTHRLRSPSPGEESRWTAQSKEFDSQIQRLTGDCAVASAFVSYLGPFNKEFRELLMSRDFYGDCVKLGIPVTNNIQVGAGAGRVQGSGVDWRRGVRRGW